MGRAAAARPPDGDVWGRFGSGRTLAGGAGLGWDGTGEPDVAAGGVVTDAAPPARGGGGVGTRPVCCADTAVVETSTIIVVTARILFIPGPFRGLKA